MAEAAVIKQSPYREDYVRLVRGRSEPDFVARLRRDGIERFERLGLPHRKQEAWRFTDLSAFDPQRFTCAGDAPLDAARLPQALADGPRLVFVNGRFSPGLSRMRDLPRGVWVDSLRVAIDAQPEWVERHLGRLPEPADYPFAALNDALFEDGAVIHLAPGRVLEQPIELVYCSTGNGIASYPRNLLVLNEAAQADVIEWHLGAGGYFSAPQTELLLEQGARCRFHKLMQETAEAWHLGALRLGQARDSRAQAHLLSAGGRLNRTEILARLDGEGADCALHGLSLVEDGELADHHVRIEHAKPHGNSRQLFKSVLDGRSRAVFDGLIKVFEQAQKTDASQTSRNLLLGTRALANANPRLEILADDVKCAHGSTVGFLDPDALFYLRSRGIDAEQAQAMLVFAFANEQLEHLELLVLRERLEALLVERYFPQALVEDKTS